ncbi:MULTISPECIES: hypothetical protein [unclassified Rickettsia]|uniref:hypothetical protein n=1 Tax=unclassified Rickettsia TaxID=114295 RepID=UPI003132DA99
MDGFKTFSMSFPPRRRALLHGSKINKNPSWRSHEVAVAIQVIPNIMRDLIRILNKFSIKICLYLLATAPRGASP